MPMPLDDMLQPNGQRVNPSFCLVAKCADTSDQRSEQFTA
jgi:hypothetical protein